MRAKGGDVGKWNWQALDRQEGFIPNDEDNKANEDNIDIEDEILYADDALRRERGFQYRAVAAASSKSMYVDRLNDSLIKGSDGGFDKSPSMSKR